MSPTVCVLLVLAAYAAGSAVTLLLVFGLPLIKEAQQRAHAASRCPDDASGLP